MHLTLSIALDSTELFSSQPISPHFFHPTRFYLLYSTSLIPAHLIPLHSYHSFPFIFISTSLFPFHPISSHSFQPPDFSSFFHPTRFHLTFAISPDSTSLFLSHPTPPHYIHPTRFHLIFSIPLDSTSFFHPT